MRRMARRAAVYGSGTSRPRIPRAAARAAAGSMTTEITTSKGGGLRVSETLLAPHVVTAAAGLLGAVIGIGGATLQHFLSRAADARRHQRELRSTAYSDYLRSVGETETGRHVDPMRKAEIIARAIA